MTMPSDSCSEDMPQEKLTVSMELSRELLWRIEDFRKQLGFRTRGEAITLILEEVLIEGSEEQS